MDPPPDTGGKKKKSAPPPGKPPKAPPKPKKKKAAPIPDQPVVEEIPQAANEQPKPKKKAVGFAGVVDDSPKNQIRKTYYPANNPDVEVEDVDDETFTEKIKEESKKIKWVYSRYWMALS